MRNAAVPPRGHGLRGVGGDLGRDPEDDLTEGQAREWVHRQLIVDELDCAQLEAVFTVLTERAPNALDRQNGLFRSCCEIVLVSVPAAPPTHVTPEPPKRMPQAPRSTRSIKS